MFVNVLMSCSVDLNVVYTASITGRFEDPTVVSIKVADFCDILQCSLIIDEELVTCTP